MYKAADKNFQFNEQNVFAMQLSRMCNVKNKTMNCNKEGMVQGTNTCNLLRTRCWISFSGTHKSEKKSMLRQHYKIKKTEIKFCRYDDKSLLNEKIA